ncbi:hypothetical protein [Maricaulis sp.]|uniref:hypothetical protein n=1 Tax=Maricaulis sp. TaxID=1486257 RepID=UPI003A8CDA06
MFNSFSVSHADKGDRSAVIEALAVSLLIGFLPLVLGSLGQMAQFGFADGVRRVFFSGDLYFYAMSICGGIYTISQASSADGNKGMRLWSGLFVIVCAVAMAFYVGQAPQTGGAQLFHGLGAVVFLVLAIVIHYRVQVRTETPPPSPEEVNRERVEAVLSKVDGDYD